MYKFFNFEIKNWFLLLGCCQVRGELPFPKCKVALDSVIFTDKSSAGKVASNFADIVTQMAQDVSFLIVFLFLVPVCNLSYFFTGC